MNIKEFVLKCGRVIIWSFKGDKEYAFSQFNFTNALFTFYLHLKNAKTDKQQTKAVIFDFKDGKLERYMFNLMNIYKLNNYAIFLKPHYSFYATCEDNYGLKIFSYLHVDIYRGENQVSRFEKVHVVTYKTGGINLKNLQKTLHVHLDGLSKSLTNILCPFSFHPSIYVTNSLRTISDVHTHRKQATKLEKRSFCIFFGGQVHDEMYKKLNVFFPDLINRNNLFDIIFNEFKKNILTTVDVDEIGVTSGQYQRPVVILNRRENNIRHNNWFKLLGNSNFFIAPPGFEMPMCHNVIEAMACGAIPIIQYGDYFHPKLENNRNCLTFNDENQLLDVIRKALHMPASKISVLRENVLNYYENHLDAETFVTKIEKHHEAHLEVSIIAGNKSIEASL